MESEAGMRRSVVAGLILLLSACSDKDGASPPALPESSASSGARNTAASDPAPAAIVLRADGVGPIRFGMTLAQAEQASGGKAVLPAPLDPACSMVRFPGLPKLRFMVENGIVTRADAEPGAENALGVAVGATLAQVRARRPEVQVSAHKYDQNGHYLSFPDADGRAAVIMEESGGRVTRIRAGLQPSVAYVETCG